MVKKIAIVTAFKNMPESYSLVNDVIDQIKTLKKYNHDVVFFAQEGCNDKRIECETKAVIPHFKTERNIENPEVKKRMIDIFQKELKDFDIVITHDLMYLQGYYTHRKAIMECNLPNVKWIHWSHSGVGDRLKLKMPKSKYIYMNYIDVQRFAEAINVEVNDVRVIFNNKDPRLFFEWNLITCEIADKVNLFDRDIIQTYPMCSTRMNAKGLDHVIKVFGKLKTLGNKVLLIVPNSNSRKKKDEIAEKIKYAKEQGLTEDEIIFTSELNKEWERQVPRQVVRDLMQISNLFIFPSKSEVCSNVLLEASMTKHLIVLNKDFPALFDFGEEGRTCLSWNFGSLIQLGFKYRTEEGYMNLAKIIHQHLQQSKENQQFRKILKETNIDTIYHRQFLPLISEDY